MIKYPSIEQFRNVIRTVKTQHDYKGKDDQGEPVYRHDSPYPTLTFTGTVKLHGTNASIVKYKDGTFKFQSRENELSLTQDNAGFMMYMSNIEELKYLVDGIFDYNEYAATIDKTMMWSDIDIVNQESINQINKLYQK